MISPISSHRDDSLDDSHQSAMILIFTIWQLGSKEAIEYFTKLMDKRCENKKKPLYLEFEFASLEEFDEFCEFLFKNSDKITNPKKISLIAECYYEKESELTAQQVYKKWEKSLLKGSNIIP